MDVDETAIIEEYGSSLEDLTFNSKPLINVLTMLAEENSNYAPSITKLIEERIFKVPQQHKLPSLYLLDSIIKNVGGDYLNLIAQVLVKVFVAVFEKGDEKVRKDLYKLRHTWPQYFSAKVLHEVDVSINKIDNGWPVTAIPPPSPSIHVNPKFLKKAEVSVPPVAAPEVVMNDDEKIILLEQQKRLQELQRLQEEQLRLTEQEIQEHQMKRDLILKKQEQERKAFITQQQQLLLTLRLGNTLGETEEASVPKSSGSTEVQPVLTKAETTKSKQGTTVNRDPRLRHKDQTPSHNNNNRPQQSRSNLTSERSVEQSKPTEPAHKELDTYRGNRDKGRAQDQEINHSSDKSHGTKRRSRSQSPFDGREKKYQRPDRDTKPDSDRIARPREDARTKRRRSLEDDKIPDFKKERSDRQGPENRNFRGRGYSGRGREWNGRSEREPRPDFERKARDFEGRGGRGRGEKPKLRFKRRQPPEEEQRNQPRPSETAGERGPLSKRGKDVPQDDLRSHLEPKPLPINESEGGVPSSDAEFATVPQELTLEHKSVILEEAKRRLDQGLISQDQYIELIDKLAEFYELQRKQELEGTQQISDVQLNERKPQQLPEKHGPPEFEHQRSESTRGRERIGPARNNGPRMEGPRHPPRDGPPRRGPRMEEPWRREGPGMMEGPERMDRPPVRMGGPENFDGPPRPGRRMRREEPHMDPHHMMRGPPRREGSPLMDLPGPPPPNENGPWRTVEHDRVPPPHDLGPPNHHRFPEGPHPMDEGHPGPFLPQGRDARDFRGPPPMEDFHGGPSRPFEEPFHGEPHHPPEMVPIGHGRPMEHFQGHPVGPGHGGPPHEPPHGPPLQPIQMSGSPLRQVGTGTPPPLPDPPTPSRMDKKTVDDLFSRLVHAGIIKVTEERIVDTPPRIATPPTSIPIQPIHPGQPIPVSQPGHMIPTSIPIQPIPVSQPGHMIPTSIPIQPIAVSQPGHMIPIQQPQLPVPQPIPPSSQAIVPSLPSQVVPVVSQAATSSLNLLQKMIEKSKEAATKIPQIGLKSINDLRKRHIGIINMLYEGTQCSSCGLRFAGEAAAFYREHLDWHFRRNRREKDGRRIAHKQWYIPLKDWLDYEEITDPEEKAHSSFFDSEKPENDANESKNLETDGSCPVLPGDKEAETKCDVCQEKFNLFWDEANEEWRYKDAVRIDGKTYHHLCYQDAKSTHVEETEPEPETSKEIIEEPPKNEKEDSDNTAKPDTKEDQSSVEVKQESKMGEDEKTKEDSISKEDKVPDKGNVLSKEKNVEEGEKVEDPIKQSTEKSAEEIKEEKMNKNIDDTESISVNKEEKTPVAGK